MELYWKSVAGLLIAVLLGLALGKDMSVLLCVTVCAMGAAVVVHYLTPVLSFFEQMEDSVNFQSDSLSILMKILGIGIVSEIASMVLSDAGSGAMGKLLKILSSAAILWISIPSFQSLLTLLQQILEEV